MKHPTISASHISKQFTIGSRDSFHSLRDSVSSIFDIRSRLKPKPSFWALDDVSFDLHAGDTVGIIGRNGAGKSTLLKVLSQITPPSKGEITMRGRVASLLEVGTGFHLELTGRENIFLNGAILGMTRQEIKKNFDRIVDFSEVEKFLDTPVKHYSSGMYVRLAFSVAAHLESEILIVDEVLAVGDRQFQKKCLGKMEEVGKEGKTVLFVSHNMSLIKELCDKSILLDKGKLLQFGKTQDVIATYLDQGDDLSSADLDLSPEQFHKSSLLKSAFCFTHLKVKNAQNKCTSAIEFQEPFEVEITGSLKKPVRDLNIALSVNSSLGFPISTIHATTASHKIGEKPGNIHVTVRFDPNILGPGSYSLGLHAQGSGVLDWVPDIMTLQLEHFSSNQSKHTHSDYEGVVIMPYKLSATNTKQK